MGTISEKFDLRKAEDENEYMIGLDKDSGPLQRHNATRTQHQ